MTKMTNHSDRMYNRPGGFTLVELLVSIALMVMLILGINMVFTSAGKTVGTGMAVSEVTRGFRAAYTTIRNDIEQNPAKTIGMLPLDTASADCAPFLVISNQALRNGYLDSQAQQAGQTQDFRQDTLAFFARGSFKRQMGNSGVDPENPNQLNASMTPTDRAFIWYGHLWLPDNTSTFQFTNTFPGAGTQFSNPNNFYARDWNLGRIPIGIVQRAIPSGPLYDLNGQQQWYIGRDLAYTDPSRLSPFSYGSQGTLDGVTFQPTAQVQETVIDVAACSLAPADYPQTVADHASIRPANDNWGYAKFVQNYRFQASPFVVRTTNQAQMASASARTVPLFLKGCTNFVVEFAGDFDRDGAIDVTPDGTAIQWYGLPDASRGVMTVGQRFPADPHSFEHKISNDLYVWAWSKYELNRPAKDGGRPSLIRLTVTLTDSNGRLPDGMTQEFIFEVPKD